MIFSSLDMPAMPGTYSDVHGTEAILIENDGRTLRTQIRGVWFEGTDFDGLTAQSDTNAFTLLSGDVCDCTIKVDLPVRLHAPAGWRSAIIHAEIILGPPGPRGSIESEIIKVAMHETEFDITTPGRSGWFEDELLILSAQLPPGFRLEACITCGLSDYSPYGHGCFGCLACFRDAKEDYRRVNSKQGIFAIWDRLTGYVQETYYCDQYEIRPKGRGYRG